MRLANFTGRTGSHRRGGTRVSLLLCLLFACTQSKAATPSPKEPPAAFYVDNHGWHSGIIVPRAAIPPGAWPPGVVERDFAGCVYLELGWGDRQFYPAKHPNALMALSAALIPGASVLHVAGFRPPLSGAHVWSTLVAVPCTRAELAGLCRDLGRSFETDVRGQVQRLGPGLYGMKSGFYPARGRYWIGHTCNHWTARELRAGGLPAHADFLRAFTSGQVVGQAQRLQTQSVQTKAAGSSPASPHPAKSEPKPSA